MRSSLAGFLFVVLVCSPSMAQQIGSWSVAPYGQAQPVLDGDAIAIKVAPPPAAGVILKTTAEPAQSYELRLSGSKVTGAPTLRIRLDDKDPEYLPAPDGAKRRVVSGARSVEVMIYGEAAFEYRLRTISLKPCHNCPAARRTPEDLQAIAPGWTPEFLGGPSIVPEPGGVLLEGFGGDQEGAFLRKAPDGTNSQRLIVRGRRIAGNPSLRLKFGDEEPRWVSVPDGSAEWTVPGGSSVEVLIYSPQPFQYRLESVELAKQ